MATMYCQNCKLAIILKSLPSSSKITTCIAKEKGFIIITTTITHTSAVAEGEVAWMTRTRKKSGSLGKKPNRLAIHTDPRPTAGSSTSLAVMKAAMKVLPLMHHGEEHKGHQPSSDWRVTDLLTLRKRRDGLNRGDRQIVNSYINNYQVGLHHLTHS